MDFPYSSKWGITVADESQEGWNHVGMEKKIDYEM